ncbi:MAG: VOC family protein [Pseudomonadota bacterium]
MINGIHHTGISVPDLDQAIAFYEQFGAFETMLRFSVPDTAENRQAAAVSHSAAKVAWLRSSTGYVELLEFEQPGNVGAPPPSVNDTGVRHICVQSQNGRALFEKAKRAGAHSHANPVELGTGNLYAYVRDPMNNVIELEGIPTATDQAASVWYAHTAYVVEDMELMLRFYENLTGYQRSQQGMFGPGVLYDTVSGLDNTCIEGGWIPLGNTNLEFWKYKTPQSKKRAPATASDLGFTHTCFEVKSVETMVDALLAQGVHFLSAPLESDASKVVFCLDPEGNLVELIEFVRTDSALSISALTA